MTSRPSSTATAVHDAQGLADVRLEANGKVRHLCGRGGRATELALAQAALAAGGLPVLLGSGLGVALDQLLAHGAQTVAVVDRETTILEATGLRQRWGDDPRILWLDAPEQGFDQVLAALTGWQMDHGGRPFAPVALPGYLRLDPDHYQALRQRLEAASAVDFWGQTRYPRFAGVQPRVLLLTTRYFLMGELQAACQRLGVPHRYLEIGAEERGSAAFVEQLLTAVVEFRPDLVLTVNHLGVDREGVLVGLLEKLRLPLASWFVDNPFLILSVYARLVNPWTALFTWDADNVAALEAMGFAHVRYLPLAADPTRFTPRPGLQTPPAWRAEVSFVGNSMVYKTLKRLEASRPTPELHAALPRLAQAFGAAAARQVDVWLADHDPVLYAAYQGLETPEQRLAYQTAVTWESTRQYRRRCLEQVLPFRPVLVGDPGWRQTFPGEGTAWRYLPELAYYDELPAFYPCSQINFNCTSLQMKGAVNQRVFDVPACGAFLLTDHRQQLEALFDPGSEVALFHQPEEIPDLLRHYLDHPGERQRIALAGRRRVLAHHTYDHRMAQLLAAMRQIFGP